MFVRSMRITLAMLALAGCTGTDGGGTDAGNTTPTDAGVSPYRSYVLDGCEHLNNGPDFPGITALPDESANLPDGGPSAVIEVEHGRTVVTLVDVTGGKGGVIRFDWAPLNAASEMWIVMEEEAVDIQISGTSGVVTAKADIDRADLPANCGSDPRRVGHLWVYELPSAGPYTLRFMASSQASVNMMLVDSEDREEG